MSARNDRGLTRGIMSCVIGILTFPALAIPPLGIVMAIVTILLARSARKAGDGAARTLGIIGAILGWVVMLPLVVLVALFFLGAAVT